MIPLRRALRRRRAKVHLKRCALKASKTRFLTLSCHEGDVHTYTAICMIPHMLKSKASPGCLAIGLIGAALPAPALDQLEPPGAWPDTPPPMTFCAAGPGRVRRRAARRRAAQRAGGGRAPARRAPAAAPAAAARGRGAAGSRAARCAPRPLGRQHVPAAVPAAACRLLGELCGLPPCSAEPRAMCWN